MPTMKGSLVFAGQFVVQDSNGAWFHLDVECYVAESLIQTTATDNTRLGAYAAPPQQIPQGVTLTFKTEPLQDYVARLKAASQFADLLRTAPRGGALKPVYIEFDLLMLFQGSAIARFFQAVGMGVEMAGGDYQGGLVSALESKAYEGLVGAAIAKIAKAVFRVPPSADPGKTLEWIEGFATLGVEQGVKSLSSGQPPPK